MVTVQAAKISTVDCKYIITTEGGSSNTVTINLSNSTFTGQVVSGASSATIGVYNSNLETITTPREVRILELRAALNDAYVLIKSDGNTIAGLKDAAKVIGSISGIPITNNIEITIYGDGSFTMWLSKTKGYNSIFDPQSKTGVTSFIGNSAV